MLAVVPRKSRIVASHEEILEAKGVGGTKREARHVA